MKWIGCGILLLLLAAAPATAQKVGVDFDKEFEFDGMRTVAWMEGTPASSEISERRIRSAIQKQLEGKGLTFIEEGEVDLFVLSHAAVSKQAKGGSMRVGVGVSRWGGRSGVSVGGSTGTKGKVVEVGTLLIEILDGESQSLVWQATASETLKDTAEKNEKLLNRALDKAFKNFPPGKKKK